ncbi:MAG: hypothetical protein ACPGSC_09435 [Granulosicoccaceae bacterium]
MGSYPFAEAGKFGTNLVARAADSEQLKQVEAELKALVPEEPDATN